MDLFSNKKGNSWMHTYRIILRNKNYASGIFSKAFFPYDWRRWYKLRQLLLSCVGHEFYQIFVPNLVNKLGTKMLRPKSLSLPYSYHVHWCAYAQRDQVINPTYWVELSIIRLVSNSITVSKMIFRLPVSSSRSTWDGWIIDGPLYLIFKSNKGSWLD